MVAEARQSYRGVICIHCHQSTPLTPSAESKEQRHKDGAHIAEDEFAIFSNPLRCRACGKEAVYTAKDVRDFEGSPRKRPRRRSPYLLPPVRVVPFRAVRQTQAPSSRQHRAPSEGHQAWCLPEHLERCRSPRIGSHRGRCDGWRRY